MKAYLLELYQDEMSSWRVVYYKNGDFAGCEEFDSLLNASKAKEAWESEITENNT